jgi:hypothetical protein
VDVNQAALHGEGQYFSRPVAQAPLHCVLYPIDQEIETFGQLIDRVPPEIALAADRLRIMTALTEGDVRLFPKSRVSAENAMREAGRSAPCRLRVPKFGLAVRSAPIFDGPGGLVSAGAVPVQRRGRRAPAGAASAWVRVYGTSVPLDAERRDLGLQRVPLVCF